VEGENTFIGLEIENPFVTKLTPNVLAEWLARLLHTVDVPGSNLVPETGYPD
jgi:hypothetical protein